ncbi:hypothetical protein ACIRQP_32990 [Streptomyces sp. NPDC102274]|uniref:hypothetical protein n=1 Tax=Streptomyces sp. NPDC102274 TaxID=3366151 RepID=UPI00382CB486
MTPFVFRHGQGPWPGGLTLPHAYAVADLSRAPLRIEAVELFDVTANAEEKTITWEPIAPPIPLGADL